MWRFRTRCSLSIVIPAVLFIGILRNVAEREDCSTIDNRVDRVRPKTSVSEHERHEVNAEQDAPALRQVHVAGGLLNDAIRSRSGEENESLPVIYGRRNVRRVQRVISALNLSKRKPSYLRTFFQDTH
jgi:hypothetical protein